MIRRFNYTKRRRIPHGKVSVKLQPGGEAPSFDASFDLEGLGLPESAKVFVEAHYKSSYQRFDFGTVGSLTAPDKRVLDEVDRGNTILFRLKIVDADGTHGRIVAEADDICPEDTGGGTESARYCILPVNFVDLGQQLWRVRLDDTRPVLEVSAFPEAESFVRSDPYFIGLVFPEAMRQILSLALDEWEGFEDAVEWKANWVRFAKTFAAEDPPGEGADDEARHEWIETVIGEFSKRLRLKDKLLEARREGAR